MPEICLQKVFYYFVLVGLRHIIGIVRSEHFLVKWSKSDFIFLSLFTYCVRLF